VYTYTTAYYIRTRLPHHWCWPQCTL